MNIINKWKRLAEYLFRLFDPSDSHVEEEISTTGNKDFEEILILTRRIGLWKSNSVPKTSRSLNTFRHHAAQISASISIFYSVAHPSNFPFGMGGGGGGGGRFNEYWCMFGTRLNDFCPRDLVIIERGVKEWFIESFGCLKSLFLCDQRNIQDKTPFFLSLGGREGNCILIPASLKLGLGVTIVNGQIENSNTWDFLLQLL